MPLRFVSLQGQILNRIVLCVLAFSLLSSTTLAADPKCKEPSISIDAENMSGADQKIFEQAVRAAIKKVCVWWGPTYTGAIKVNMEDSWGPSMALTPGWNGKRGTMLFRTSRTVEGRSAITHEVIHVFAPNGNRFLAEGFGVYAQEHLGVNNAFPNFGRELHDLAIQYLDAIDLFAMDRRATPDDLVTKSSIEQEAYIVAGSYFKFLINIQGLEKFRRLYAMTPMVPQSRGKSGSPERWTKIYGSDLKTLEKSWKQFLTTP